jgi:hypothetical protein
MPFESFARTSVLPGVVSLGLRTIVLPHAWCRLTPGLECALCCFDGGVDVFLGGDRRTPDYTLVHGVDQVECFRRGRGDEFTVDVVLEYDDRHRYRFLSRSNEFRPR